MFCVLLFASTNCDRFSHAKFIYRRARGDSNWIFRRLNFVLFTRRRRGVGVGRAIFVATNSSGRSSKWMLHWCWRWRAFCCKKVIKIWRQWHRCRHTVRLCRINGTNTNWIYRRRRWPRRAPVKSTITTPRVSSTWTHLRICCERFAPHLFHIRILSLQILLPIVVHTMLQEKRCNDEGAFLFRSVLAAIDSTATEWTQWD